MPLKVISLGYPKPGSGNLEIREIEIFFQSSQNEYYSMRSYMLIDNININKFQNKCLDHINICPYHIMYSYQSEFTFYSCLNVKELLDRNRREIWSLSDCNGTRTHNHLVRKRCNHLVRNLVFVYELSGCGFESRCSHSPI